MTLDDTLTAQVIVSGLLVILTVAVVAWFYRKRISENARKTETRFRAIIDASPVPMAGNDTQMNVTFCNAAFERLFGYSSAAIPTLADWWRLAYPAPEYRQWVMETWQAEVERTQRSVSPFSPLEVKVTCHNGDDKTVLVHMAPLSTSPAGEQVVVFIDITERKAAEARIVRLSMLYAALSECSQAIVHSTSTHEMLPKICHKVVELGGMKLAWIGLLDTADGQVRPVAVHGTGTEYVSVISISANANDPAGGGPIGISIRENQPVWCQDFQNDPRTVPWHERGANYGWQACASLPLHLKGKAVGALAIYSDQTHAFDEESQELLLDMAENISFGIEHFADEAQRQQGEEERQALRTAVEQTANTIVITNPSGVIEYANPAFEQSTGYTVAEALGKKPSIINSGEQGAIYYQQLWKTIQSGRIWRGEFHNRRKDGSLYWESAIITPVHNDRGDIVRFIAIKEDVTARKAMEDSLLNALEHAEAGNRAKNEFLAVMSHELRTPLNGVLGCAALLAETPLDEEQRNYARMIRDSGNHLLVVVNDLLDFSSIKRGTMALKSTPVVIAELVESCCQPWRQPSANKRLKFSGEIADGVPDIILGDAQRIRQILLNILGNAVKFTSQGAVTLRVTSATLAGQPAVDFTVQDTGIGILDENISLLFNPFAQADSTLSRPFDGTGLGLAISHRLAEAMGGTITVTSTLGQGSTFTVRLPIVTGPRHDRA